MKKIGLIALDMDGTLYNNRGEISQKDKETLKRATEAGIAVAVATGRAFREVPREFLMEVGVRYAITGNGSEIYRMEDQKCIFSDCMDKEVVLAILAELQQLHVYYDVYADGIPYCPKGSKELFRQMGFTDALIDQLMRSRFEVDDLEEFLKTSGKEVGKATVNFVRLEDGSCLHRVETEEILKSYPQVEYLSGGFSNWEFTKAGVTKGSGLHLLAEILGVPMDQTMACGDSGNDLPMLKEAALAVAMENAAEEVKEAAAFITLSNEESGVAYAVEKFALNGR